MAAFQIGKWLVRATVRLQFKASNQGPLCTSRTWKVLVLLLAPVLVGFRARFPRVTVRLVLVNELVDLMRDGVDLALRVGRPGAGEVRCACSSSASSVSASIIKAKRLVSSILEHLF